MSTVSKADLVKRYATVLRGFGVDRTDLGAPHEGDAPFTLESIADDLSDVRPRELHDLLGRVLAQSARGIEAPREYWSRAPAFHLSDVLAPYGYEVGVEPAGNGSGETLEVTLAGDDRTGVRRMTFSYPDTEYGTDNYPALVHAVETRLLPEPDLRFVLLADDEECWRFVLVEEDALSALRDAFGPRIEPFGRPLLAPDQPAEFTGERGPGGDETADDGPEEVATLSSVPDIEDAFEQVEREAATQPIGGSRSDESLEVGGDVAALLRTVEVDRSEASTMADVTDERLEGVLDRIDDDRTVTADGSSFRWVSGGGSPRRPANRVGDTGRLGRTGGLSEQVAETLFPDGADAADPGPTLGRETPGRNSSTPGAPTGRESEAPSAPTREGATTTDERASTDAGIEDSELMADAARVFGDLAPSTDDSSSRTKPSTGRTGTTRDERDRKERTGRPDTAGTADSGEAPDSVGRQILGEDRGDAPRREAQSGTEDRQDRRTRSDPPADENRWGDDRWTLSGEEDTTPDRGAVGRLTDLVRRLL